MEVVAIRRAVITCKGCGKVIKGNNFVIIHGLTYCSKFCVQE